jgi:hypothetical protein
MPRLDRGIHASTGNHISALRTDAAIQRGIHASRLRNRRRNVKIA